MSRPKTPRIQYEITQQLLVEIKQLSEIKSWKDFYVEIEKEKQGCVTGESHLRALVSGHRFLSVAKLREIAEWAKSKKWAGKCVDLALKYYFPSEDEQDEEKKYKKSERYTQKIPPERLVGEALRAYHQAQRKCAGELSSVLAKMSPAGFSNADVMYMVHSWLTKNPETGKRGKRQRPLVGWDLSMGSGFDMPVEPNQLPKNFVMEEHLNDERLYFLCLFNIPENIMKAVKLILNVAYLEKQPGKFKKSPAIQSEKNSTKPTEEDTDFLTLLANLPLEAPSRKNKKTSLPK